MKHAMLFMRIGCIALLGMSVSAALAKLPAPTAEQAQAAAEKKAKAAAQAEKDKQELTASMDALASRWRAKASANGWETHAPTTIAAPAQATATPATQSGPSGQPQGKQTDVSASMPIRSEKLNTAPPSEDVKKPESTKAGPAQLRAR